MKLTSLFFFIIIILYSCANIVMPTGGEKDLSPPQIINNYPASSNTGFSLGEISFVFDE